MKYKYTLSLSSPRLYPVLSFIAECQYDTGESKKSINENRNCDWGMPTFIVFLDNEELSMPSRLRLKWLSLSERKNYHFSGDFDKEKAERLWQPQMDDEKSSFRYIVVGLAPYGGVAVWLRGYFNAVLISWTKAIETVVPPTSGWAKDIDSLCNKFLAENDIVRENLQKKGLPPANFYDNIMFQHNYRLLPVLKKWDSEGKVWEDYSEEEIKPQLNYIEIECFDGTFDKLHNGKLQLYHEAGIPKRICTYWHVGKRQYSAYFFIKDVEKIANLLHRINKKNHEEKFDFLLQMDPDQERFVISLKNDELPEPVELGNDTVDVMVFRNRLECYRSPGYSQPKGAWRW